MVGMGGATKYALLRGAGEQEKMCIRDRDNALAMVDNVVSMKLGL